MKADQGFDSLAKRAYYSASLYYSTEEKAPYWPAEKHSSKSMNGKPVYIARVIFTSPPTISSILI